MRHALIASLFLSSVLLNAQTATKGQSATLEASSESANTLPAPAAASHASDVAAVQPARRVSTGVTWPKLISEPVVNVSAADFPTNELSTQHMLVSFRVDENGIPQNVHMVKPVNEIVDERVLEAVRQYHFEPGTLDDRAVPIDVNLMVNFQ